MVDYKTKTCQTCGISYSPKDERKNRISKFCSQKCIKNSGTFKIGHKRTPIGNTRWDNPKTKGSWFKKGEKPPFSYFHAGMTPWNKGMNYGKSQKLRDKLMNLSIYRKWRDEVKSLKGKSCVLCSASKEIQIDHYPKSFRNIVIENELTSVEQAKKCKILWDIRNGRPLCFSCHKKTESYGRQRLQKNR